ncbi:MAG TPA: VWA domain-containing protein [Thermoanaerobaculia bacterium]|nr:VWA domain-containing protein [Thermoanaerobaculia bacterium]
MIAPGLFRSFTTLLLAPALALGGVLLAPTTLGPFAAPAAAQEPPPPGGPAPSDAVPLVFGEVLDVRVVNVEVVVTDRDGERVRGLDAGQFRLKVDGEEVPIDYFSEIVGGEVVTRDGADPAREVPTLSPGTPVGTSYLVFVDDYFSISRDRDRVLRALEQQLARLRPEDRMAIVAFDGRELTMLTTWTNSERVLRDALRAAQRRPTQGLMRMAELRQNDQDRRHRREIEATSLAFLDQNDPQQRRIEMRLDPAELGYATRLVDQLRRSVDATVATLRGFADPPGRKAMLLLSGGWPHNPAEYTVNDYDADFLDVVSAGADRRIPVGRELFGTLADAANLLGYTLYPVDVPGLVRESRDASFGAPTTEAAGSLGGIFPRELQSHASLEFLARETGGRALINSLRDEALELVEGDTRSYYWLGFSPQRAQDDKPHRIEVEVLVPGLRVRSRESFLDFSRSKELTMMVESALLFGSPPSTTPLELRFGNPERAGVGKMSLPLEVGIPMEAITLIEQAGRYAADLELRITVMEDRGGRSDTPVTTIQIRGDRPPRSGELFRYVTNLQMRRKPHRVVVAAWDPVSGAILSSSAEVRP